MARSKHVRSMNMVGAAQQVVEKEVSDKFASVQELAQPKVVKPVEPTGRINPQLSCTITPEDKEVLNALSLFLSNKAGRVLNTSLVIRSLIRLGNFYKEELEI